MRLLARNSQAAARLVMLLALLAAASAQAKSTDRDQPMDIEADNTDALISDDSESTLMGNVNITQGSLTVKADQAVIQRRAGEITTVTLTGSPATLTQVNDNGEPMTARARRIVYTRSSEIMLLTGGVEIEQPRGTLRGESVKYDINTGRLDGGGDGSRVQMRITPKAKKEAGN